MEKYFILGEMDPIEKRQRGRPRAFTPSPDAGLVQSLDRGMRVLETVSGGDGLSLSEIAAASGLPAPTVYRMLRTLEAHGMVEFDRTEQLWSTGVGAYSMGAAFLRRRKLGDRARAFLHMLGDETGETANLGVAEDDRVVFVTQVETHQAIRAFFRPGSRSHFHASGIGKAIMAHLPEARVRAIVTTAGLEGFTANTLVSVDALIADLEHVRARGWAVDDEERHAGMRCVAAAIFNEHGEPFAGISVSGPGVRMTPERIAGFGPKIARAAAEITALVGGKMPDGG